MPNRILRDGILNSPRFNKLSDGAKLLYYRLMSVVDDYGRYHANESTVRCACWPLCPNNYSDREIKKYLAECAHGDSPLLTFYEVDGFHYLVLNDFGQQVGAKSK